MRMAAAQEDANQTRSPTRMVGAKVDCLLYEGLQMRVRRPPTTGVAMGRHGGIVLPLLQQVPHRADG
jgi:hypothetical protein